MHVSALLLTALLAAAGAPEPPAPPAPPRAAEPAPAAPPKAAGTGRLVIELRDSETRKPAAARARVSLGDREFAPAGATAAGGGVFLVDGSAELQVPAGSCQLQINAGPLRLPYDKTVEIAPGAREKRTVYLVTPRHLAFERAGWYPADPLYSAGALPPERAVLAARAAGLAAVGLDVPGPAGARAPRRPRDFPVLSWSLSADPRFGSGCTLAGPGGPGFSFYLDCGRPRRVNPWKSLVPWRPELREFYDPLAEATVGLAPRMYYELLAGDRVGGFELDGSAAAERLWFALLNEGWRVPALAGTRAALADGAPPEPRMLLRVLGEPAPEALVRAAQAGRSTLSFGPFCFLTIDGKGPGEELPCAEAERRLRIRALASTGRRAEIAGIEIWRNGEVYKSLPAGPGQTCVELELPLRQEEPAWLVLKCYQRIRRTDEIGERPDPAPGAQTTAVTNPIWIAPDSYRVGSPPVRTTVIGRVLDERTGRPVEAGIVVSGPVPMERGPASQLVFQTETQNGEFRTQVSPAAEVTVMAAGYEPQRLTLFEELGLRSFAKRLAAMAPEAAVKELSSPGTFNLLRASLARCQPVIRLRPKEKKNPGGGTEPASRE